MDWSSRTVSRLIVRLSLDPLRDPVRQFRRVFCLGRHLISAARLPR